MEQAVRGMLAYRSLLDHVARILGAWARDEPDARVRQAFEGVAERNVRHVGLLDARLTSRGVVEPFPLVDRVLAHYVTAAESVVDTAGRLLFLAALNRDVGDPSCELHDCVGLIRAAYEQADAETRTFLRAIFREQERTLDELAAIGVEEAGP